MFSHFQFGSKRKLLRFCSILTKNREQKQKPKQTKCMRHSIAAQCLKMNFEIDKKKTWLLFFIIIFVLRKEEAKIKLEHAIFCTIDYDFVRNHVASVPSTAHINIHTRLPLVCEHIFFFFVFLFLPLKRTI